MTARSRMNVIPEKVCVRIHPRLILRRNSGVDEAVAPGLAQCANHVQPNVESINVDGNSVGGVSTNYGSHDRI